MKQAARQILALAAALLALFALCRLTFSRSYTARVELFGAAKEGLRLEAEDPGIISVSDVHTQDGSVTFTVRPAGRGETAVRVVGADGQTRAYRMYSVDRLGTVYDWQTRGFTGDTVMLVSSALFWLLISAIMLWHYSRAKGPGYYSQASVYFSGFSIFSLVTGGMLLMVTARHLADPLNFNMYAALDAITRASAGFMTVTMPVILVFALALAVSNLVLLKHERPSPQNALGLAVSFVLIAGEAVWLFLITRDFMGSEWEGRVRGPLENSYATVFVYFECMLAGSVICAVTAARRRPAFGKDAIIILGCFFRPDGTLPPLLKGRVDRALEFFRQQKEQSGKSAVFIPSGGQGRDEPMPEAEAMRRYLTQNGVPDASIFPETASKNTEENMLFSKKIADRVAPGGRVLFVTTSYHVFRSGICALAAGLEAEGTGGKTAWWYWPNAFMREVAGLMKKHWKEEAALLLLLIAFFAVMSMLL